MKCLKQSLYSFLACLTLILVQDSILEADNWNDPAFLQISYPERTYFSATMGQTVGIDKGYGTLEALVPISIIKTLDTYLDFRVHYIEDTRWAANIGSVWRKWNPYRNWVWGANLYYDFRDRKGKAYNQIGVGLEWLTCRFDVRVNGYFPVGSRSHTASREEFDNYTDGFKATCRKIDRAFQGYDAEIGTGLGCLGCFSLYAAAGPYYYSHNGKDQFVGGRFRAAILWQDYVKMEFRFTHDRQFRSLCQGILSFSFPFDFFADFCNYCLDPCFYDRCLITQPVQRNDMIVIDRRSCFVTNF